MGLGDCVKVKCRRSWRVPLPFARGVAQQSHASQDRLERGLEARHTGCHYAQLPLEDGLGVQVDRVPEHVACRPVHMHQRQLDDDGGGGEDAEAHDQGDDQPLADTSPHAAEEGQRVRTKMRSVHAATSPWV